MALPDWRWLFRVRRKRLPLLFHQAQRFLGRLWVCENKEQIRWSSTLVLAAPVADNREVTAMVGGR